MAILAGDALLNYAFEVAANTLHNYERVPGVIKAMQILTTAVMYIACALTLISLVTYIIDNKGVMTSM